MAARAGDFAGGKTELDRTRDKKMSTALCSSFRQSAFSEVRSLFLARCRIQAADRTLPQAVDFAHAIRLDICL